MSTDPIKPKHKTFKLNRKFTQLYLNQLLIITNMYQTLYESYVLFYVPYIWCKYDIMYKKGYLTNGRELLFSVLSNIYYNCFVVCSFIEILKETKMMLINQNYFGYVTHLEHIHHLVSNHWILFFGYKIHVDHINRWPNKMHKLKMHDV